MEVKVCGKNEDPTKPSWAKISQTFAMIKSYYKWGILEFLD